MPSSQAHLYLKREQLYELVWAKPMQHLAKEYGISDRALAKLCKRHQVPVPSRGYWARIGAGQKIAKPPLSAFVPKQPTKDRTASSEAKKVSENLIKPKAAAPTISYWAERDKKVKLAAKALRNRFANSYHYKISVTDWFYDYSFGLNSRYDPQYKKDHFAFMHTEPFDELKSFVFEGIFISPPEFKNQKVHFNLFSRSYLNAQERNKNSRDYEEAPPESIGNLQKQKVSHWAFVSCPEDAIQGILQTASANKINFISLCTEKMRYGQASILRFSLHAKNEEDEAYD